MDLEFDSAESEVQPEVLVLADVLTLGGDTVEIQEVDLNVFTLAEVYGSGVLEVLV